MYSFYGMNTVFVVEKMLVYERNCLWNAESAT